MTYVVCVNNMQHTHMFLAIVLTQESVPTLLRTEIVWYCTVFDGKILNLNYTNPHFNECRLQVNYSNDNSISKSTVKT